ncbi:unnamed protein product [Paramecium octaurelia]|uniref:Protein kinase domain-containing protein n=1 Tax=Paramecium octaurelia TaxID=43137 RepID=A0A8S1SF88_PAROT|nr:unnamed protein product [Paramecium octaurelia]
MHALKENFMRMQIFENSDQKDKFLNDVMKNVEIYDTESIRKVTQYYAWIQFNFSYCRPLNIFLNMMVNKQSDANNIQVKKIIIEILKHFRLLEQNSLCHGNIKPENIILIFQDYTNEIESINFTNYLFQQNQKDEENIKTIVLNLLNQIGYQELNQDNIKNKSMRDILEEIYQINLDVGNKWLNKITSWGQNASLFGQTGSVKGQARKINDWSIQFKGEIENKIREFKNEQIEIFQQEREENCNINCEEQLQTEEELRQTNKYEVSETDNQDQQVKNRSKETIEQEWLKLIKKQQEEFFLQLTDTIVQNTVEKVTSECFDHQSLQQKNEKFKDSFKVINKVDLDFIIDKYSATSVIILEKLLEIFKGIYTTFLEEWKKITDQHYKEYKFDFDLQFEDQVKEHFDELLIIIFKYSFVQQNFVNYNLLEEQKLIEKQFHEYYDDWISYKILDLINNLI